MEPFNGLFLNCSRGLDLALGKPLPEYVYFAVEKCHRRPLPSATPGFSLWQKLSESAKYQRRGSAWVRQADLGKVEAKSGNRSGNCQRNMKTHTRRKFSPCSRSFIMNGRGFYCNPAQF